MIRKRKKIRFSVYFIGFLFLLSSIDAKGTEVNRVETQGNIGFTGVYEPIGLPDPKPPEPIKRPPIIDSAKPGGSLPQTNDRAQTWLFWWGMVLIIYVSKRWNKGKHT